MRFKWNLRDDEGMAQIDASNSIWLIDGSDEEIYATLVRMMEIIWAEEGSFEVINDD